MTHTIRPRKYFSSAAQLHIRVNDKGSYDNKSFLDITDSCTVAPEVKKSANRMHRVLTFTNVLAFYVVINNKRVQATVFIIGFRFVVFQY